MLKTIAMIAMVIDHIAVAFLPTSPLYLYARLIGRLAMPIFAYKIACGFLYTHNLKRYALNIALMTLAAQIPFTLLNDNGPFTKAVLTHWNIGVTFLCALGVLALLHNAKPIPLLLRAFILFILLFVASYADYGLYGVAMVLIFYYCITHHTSIYLCLVSLGILTILYYALSMPSLATYMINMQFPALLAIPLIYYVPDHKMKWGKSFFYIFYPLHMLFLVILKFFIVSF